MVICLCCEFLGEIGAAVNIFTQESIVLSDKLQKFGEKIVSNMYEVQRAFMDIDFKDRTVFNIITTNGFAPLMADPKVSVLLEETWMGK